MMINELTHRFDRVREQMDQQGIDHLLIGPSSDLIYMLNYEKRQSERLTLLVVPRKGQPRLVIPSFELPHIEKFSALVEPVSWTETEDPTETLARLIENRGRGQRIAVGGQLFTYFLLAIQAVMPDAEYLPGELVMNPVRMRKSAYEIDRLRVAGQAADQVFLALIKMPLVGLTELEVLSHIHRLLVEKGHDSVGGGIVGAGPNGASPHHHVGTRRLHTGDAVVIDYGGILDGYKSDMTRTFHIGEPSDGFRHVYEIVNEANQKAFEAVRPGVPAEEIDAVARNHIAAAGYGPRFLHRTGHGIGLDTHEPPYIVSGNRTPLDVGMTFSIEPGIYLEGQYGVRIEDIAVVTQGGAERLNTSTHQLQII